jgi:hypothetical protein
MLAAAFMLHQARGTVVDHSKSTKFVLFIHVDEQYKLWTNDVVKQATPFPGRKPFDQSEILFSREEAKYGQHATDNGGG